ncbi:LPXTG cell wall anchor domain-containing protein [Secundilactobacillus mixtipabuli]|uniref:Cell surface protein n=1 Tax=Secundilactobacillus mixtipabuli TaxID=1435342 RepID=A0A1Z5I9N1_9LACO|nr:LPXTG cell wall anchor domain-containing protein [Secundilactobacillus mixtipabuli]GAW98424.1 cell surface protein [Secundilactobacillus mixtipabuli]
MKKKGLKGLFRGILLLILTLVSVTVFSGNNVKASTYEDGTYNLSVKANKQGTNDSSIVQNFIGTADDKTGGPAPATAVVKNDVATISLKLRGLGLTNLNGVEINQSQALNAEKDELVFSVPVGTSKVTATFDIFYGSAKMTQKCDLVLGDWNNVPKVTPNTGDNKTINNNNTSTDGQIINVSGSHNNITINNGSSNKAQGSTIDANATKLNYTVLQADEKSTSAANQYYTHVADIQKQSDGTYKITMHVQYGKNSGMTAKGFVPLTVNGQNVADVTYGSTADNYTCSFTFTTPTLDALTKAPVKGTVHVTVGLVNISSDFDVYYKFASTSGSATTNNQSAAPTSGNTNNGLNSGVLPTAGAVETPANGASATTPAANTKTVAQKSSSALPQTNEVQDIAVAAAGLISLMLIVATAIYRRKQA